MTAEELMTIANMGKGTDMMVGLNVNLTTTNGHCMLQ